MNPTHFLKHYIQKTKHKSEKLIKLTTLKKIIKPEDKPVRKKLSASNSSKKDNSSKGSKSKNLNSKIIDLLNIASLTIKLSQLAKEKKIKENPKDRTDLVNMLVALEVKKKCAHRSRHTRYSDQFGFETARPKNSPNDIMYQEVLLERIIRQGDFVLAQIDFPMKEARKDILEQSK